jgi:hypothetical protein
MGRAGNLKTKREREREREKEREREGVERSTFVLCTDKDSEFRMLLICPEKQKWR